MIRIYIVDDHKMIIDGLSALIETVEDFQVIGFGLNGKEAVDFLSKNEVDVVLMDINMPELNGTDTTEILKKLHPGIRILVLSMHDDAKHIKEILNKGADGYILKNTGKRELVQAINDLHGGKNYYGQEVTNALVMDHVKEEKPEKKVNEINLSTREKEVVKLICDEKTMTEISVELGLSEHTIRTHRKNLLRKLNVKNTAGLVKYAFENQLV